jgi:cytochrome c556
MKRAMSRLPMAVGAVTVLAACATGMTVSRDEAIRERQALMKEQGAAMRSIQDKLKAGQVQAVAVDAEKLVVTARRITPLFPAGSLDPQTSRAKPEIWQKWSDFEGYARALETKAAQLAATSRQGDAQAASAAAADLGKTTCGACHNAFRGPEIKKI